MNNQQPGEERRRFKRIPVRFDLIYKINRPPSIRISMRQKEMFAWLVDISEGGMALIAEDQFPDAVGLDLTFHLIFKDKQTPPMHAEGRVCYKIALTDIPGYRIGIEFTKIDKQDKQMILDFVNKTKDE